VFIGHAFVASPPAREIGFDVLFFGFVAHWFQLHWLAHVPGLTLNLKNLGSPLLRFF